MEYFKMFFDDASMSAISTQTNLYSTQKTDKHANTNANVMCKNIRNVYMEVV